MMRDSFRGFYSPTQSDYNVLLNEGTIVLDTNVLLNMHRIPDAARDEFLYVLKNIGERLWIPFHVGLEYQRNRLSVIYAVKNNTESLLKWANGLVDDVVDKIEPLRINERGLGLNVDEIISNLKLTGEKLVSVIEAVHKSHAEISSNDVTRDKIDEILSGRVGEPPSNQGIIDGIAKDGEIRYKYKTPPGYMDQEKSKDPSESHFTYNGIIYERKFGDLIIWREILNYAKLKSIKAILLVTADKKEDWWWKEKGRLIGPRPELSAEIKDKSGVDLFWMYTASEFLRHAKEYTSADVSEKSVSDIRAVGALDIETSGPSELADIRSDPGSNLGVVSRNAVPVKIDYLRVESAVAKWLTDLFGSIVRNPGFPDFIVKTGKSRRGFEVKNTRDIRRYVRSRQFRSALSEGNDELDFGLLDEFALVIVSSKSDIDDIVADGTLSDVRHDLDTMLDRYPVDEIIVGTADGGEFIPVFGRRRMRA